MLTTASKRQPTEPGRLKIVLGDDRAAEQAGEVETGSGDDRGEAGAQRVLADDHPLG